MVMFYTWSGIEFLGVFFIFLSENKCEDPIRLNFLILAVCCVSFASKLLFVPKFCCVFCCGILLLDKILCQSEY